MDNAKFYIPVITGDVIGSQHIPLAEREKLTETLEGIPGALTGTGITLSSADIFRGDSFQVVLKNPGEITDAAIMLRAWFRRNALADGTILDTRLGLGIGPVEFANPSQSLSDGTAFRLAAEALEKAYTDKLSQIWLKSQHLKLDNHINAVFVAIEPILSGLTAAQSQSLWWSFHGLTQSEIAAKIDVAQSTVTRALHSAHEKHLTFIRNYMRGIMESYLSDKS